MKKFFSLLVIAAMSVSMVGCGKEPAKTPTEAEKKAADEKAAAEKKAADEKAAADKKAAGM